METLVIDDEDLEFSTEDRRMLFIEHTRSLAQLVVWAGASTNFGQ
jgi:hypothetical protein